MTREEKLRKAASAVVHDARNLVPPLRHNHPELKERLDEFTKWVDALATVLFELEDEDLKEERSRARLDRIRNPVTCRCAGFYKDPNCPERDSHEHRVWAAKAR